MSEAIPTSRESLQQMLITRSTQDAKFRNELLNDPKAVIAREAGLNLPEAVDLRVVEETDTTVYLVLPALPDWDTSDLSEEEMHAVTMRNCIGSSKVGWD